MDLAVLLGSRVSAWNICALVRNQQKAEGERRAEPVSGLSRSLLWTAHRCVCHPMRIDDAFDYEPNAGALVYGLELCGSGLRLFFRGVHYPASVPLSISKLRITGKTVSHQHEGE